MYEKAVIGIDQSYNNTGISIAVGRRKLKYTSSIWLDKCEHNTERREMVKNRLQEVIEVAKRKAKNVVIYIERIRLKSQKFISIDYIKAMGALNACIVDVAKRNGIKVYSVDTRAWKSAVVGDSKPLENKYGIDAKKWRTILFVEKLIGFDKIAYEVSDRVKKGVIVRNGKRYKINDDLCDGACIALYGFEKDQKIEEEH